MPLIKQRQYMTYKLLQTGIMLNSRFTADSILELRLAECLMPNLLCNVDHIPFRLIKLDYAHHIFDLK